ncbi:unnamed protein product, partial [Dibothriocephalus latus]
MLPTNYLLSSGRFWAHSTGSRALHQSTRTLTTKRKIYNVLFFPNAPPPGKPTDLKLRTTTGSKGGAKAGRLLVATWSPPVTSATSGTETSAGSDWLQYSIQWNLLLRRHKNLADAIADEAYSLGGLSYEIRVAAFDQFQTGQEVLGRAELPDD